MDLVNIRDIFRNQAQYENQVITIGGWVRSNRNSKNFGFIVVNDGTFFEPIQVVYADGLANYDEVCKINVGAAIIVKGQLVPTPQAKQPFEIQAEEVTIEGRKSVTHSSICVQSHTFVRERTRSRRYSVCVHSVRMQSTNSSRREALSMYTPHSSQEVTVRVPARCSR